MRTFELSQNEQQQAATWLELGEPTASKPRKAAAVVVIKDAAQGLEVLLGERNPSSPLGALSFPGGSLEEGDMAALPWHGPNAEHWAKVLGISDWDVARGVVTCAIRELFEETGLLLASGPGELEANSATEILEAREAMASGELSFAEVLQRRGLKLRTDLLRPLARWVSPEFSLRRFDTAYFTIVAPAAQKVSALPSKNRWLSYVPAAQLAEQINAPGADSAEFVRNTGLEQFAGKSLLDLLAPATRAFITKLGTMPGCVAYFAGIGTVPVVLPSLSGEGDHMQVSVDTDTAASTLGIKKPA